MVTRSSLRALVAGLLACACSLSVASAAQAAFVGLPPDGSQLNNDPGAGIDPNKDVSSDTPDADVVGGTLTAGARAVPWAIFRQLTTGKDQIFVRAFKQGAWSTQGNGTVGGKSSASPTFSGSLNFDQGEDGEAPEIDFAGAGRTVPWATWYEDTAAFTDHEQIFASRFDGAQNKWVFAGQARDASSPPVPSLNIRTNQDAENPSVAGGSAVDPTKPGPWITWQETTTSPTPGKDQIFVSRPLGPGQANCDGVTPAGVGGPAIGGFCWQQTGIPRVGPGAADPSLNVDPTRDGIEPDIAFTGNNDSVPWVVWYEVGPTGIGGLIDNVETVFAAKGVSDGVGANGGFHWVVVGNALSGTLDLTGANSFGTCAASLTNEQQCSLNKNPLVDGEDPRVAAGTMDPTKPTVPWVVWDEDVGGTSQIFASRLVNGDHFELANAGSPLSLGANNSSRPDITFAGNTPYVSWREQISGGEARVFVGHFTNPATFKLDTPDGVKVSAPGISADLRPPISTGCTANPFNADGANCQGGAVGTPFFLLPDGNDGGRKLFGRAYDPTGVTTGGASGVGQSTATVSGSVNPEGAAVKAHFDFGTTTGYGSSTPDQVVGVANTAQSFSAGLSGLPAGTVIHYRAVVSSDFGTQTGADQTFTTASAGGGGNAGANAGAGAGAGAGTGIPPAVDLTPPVVTVRLGRITLKRLLKTHRLPVIVTANEPSVDDITATMTTTGGKATAAKKKKRKRKTVTVARGRVTFTAPGTKTVNLRLTGGGRRALRHRHSAKLTFTVKATDLAGNKRTTKQTTSVH